MFVGIATFVDFIEISCNRIACETGGGERWWGEVGCWCVTFFALLGLVVVEAVQNSPCWLKVGRKGVFRACGESFVPGDPSGSVCRESFVPVEASWRGARDRCESTVGTKGPAARAAGRMGASVSVVLGITGCCPAISHAIHCEHHAGLY